MSTVPRRLQRPRTRRRVLAVAAALTVPLAMTTTASAVTQITVKNPGGLTEVGPVNADHGFPSWYGDNRPGNQQIRLEPCLDLTNSLCGLLPDEVPNPELPISFPNNFPGEFFYQLGGAELDLPGGGRAVLTLGLEAAWANEVVRDGDQVVFSRTRVVVKGAPANQTLTFKHPFGELTIDTDDAGDGRIVEDISPSIGNFATPLKGNFGPFLMWDSGAPAGYVGDPDVEHTVTGSPTGFNQFSVTGGGLNQSTNLFTVSGKIAKNTGVTGDRAVVNGSYIDVFATSRGTQLEVAAGQGYAKTPMEYDDGTTRRYARIKLDAGAPVPSEVVVRNIGDDPVSTVKIPVNGVTVSKAEYDGSNLVVNAATTDSGALSVQGVGALTGGSGSFPMFAPPASVTVTDGRTSTTVPVTISGGDASPVGLPPIPPGPDTPPVVDTGGGTGTGGGGTTTVVAPGAPTGVTAKAGLGSVALSWTAPASTGGAPITGYTVTTTRASGTAPAPVTVTGTTATISGLTNGTSYSFTVAATNSAGSTAARAITAKPGDTITAALGRNKNGDIRITGTGTLSGVVVTVYRTTSQVNVGNVNASTKLGTATNTPAVAPATGITWEYRIRTGNAFPAGTIVWAQSTGGGIASFRV